MRVRREVAGWVASILLLMCWSTSAEAAPISTGYNAILSGTSGGAIEDDLFIYNVQEVTPSGDDLKILFQAPSGCSSVTGEKFACQGGDREFRPILNGVSRAPVSYSLDVAAEGVVLTASEVNGGVIVSGVVGEGASAIQAGALEDLSLKESAWIEKGTVGQASTLAMAGPVTVPRGYIYCPYIGCRDRTLHDYCSYSPDSWGAADFRGPCAYHDMAIERIRSMNITLDAKRSARRSADASLIRRMQYNCRWYYAGNMAVIPCSQFTLIYKAAIAYKTNTWNGR